MAKTIGIISIKGGVGKTSITNSLGAALAKEFNKKVLLIDGNFSAPNLALHLGLIDPDVTLHHVLNDKIEMEKAVYESEYGFHIVPGAVISGPVNPFKLRSKLKSVQKYYDIILIDSSPALNNEITASIIASDELYIVTTPDHVTMNATVNAINLARRKNIPVKGIIVNKVYDKNFELSLEEIEKVSGSKVLAMLPHELNVLESLSNMTPVSGKNIKFSKEIKSLAAALIGENTPKGFLDQIKGFLRLTPKQEINRQALSKEVNF